MTGPAQTEASCLLQSGALYRTRVGLMAAAGDGHLVLAGFKRGAFSMYFGDAPIYHFDLEGRWQRAYIEPTHYLKSLDTRVHAIDRVREGANLVLKRRALDSEETGRLDLQVRGIALGLIGELDRNRVRRQEPPSEKAKPLETDALREFLGRIAAWDSDSWDAHRAEYRATYGPLPFLPPECQNAVVLQATCGNAGGICFGHGQVSEHQIRTPREFSQHTERVARLLGRRLLQSRVAFLGGSDVLRRPPDQFMRFLEILADHLPISSDRSARTSADGDAAGLEGIHSFLDDFSTGLPGPEALRAYHDRHLVHVSLGVESGDARIRGLFGRSWTDEDLRRFVADLRSAGIGLSLMTLVGAGGPEFAPEHVAATAPLIASLELGRGDTVFLLDERELRNEVACGTDSSRWNGEDWQLQQSKMKLAFAPLKERGAKVLPYSLDKQWG
jgi:hypothetical protein